MLRDEQRVTIRLATRQHLPDLISIGNESGASVRWSDLQYVSLFDGNPDFRLVLVAETEPSGQRESRKVTGFLIARQVPPEWELENIVVAPEARGRGIGTSLMVEFLGRAQQSGGESVFLEVRESNAAARALYEKLRFQQSGRHKSYYVNPMEDAILYAKKLGESISS